MLEASASSPLTDKNLQLQDSAFYIPVAEYGPEQLEDIIIQRRGFTSRRLGSPKLSPDLLIWPNVD